MNIETEAVVLWAKQFLILRQLFLCAILEHIFCFCDSFRQNLAFKLLEKQVFYKENT